MAAEFAFDFNTALPLEWPQEQVSEPKRELPQTQKKRQTISKEELRKNSRLNNITVAKIFIVMALAIFVIGICAHSYGMKDLSLINLETATEKLERQKDRNVVLTDKLNKLATEDNIDRIASQLGLVKISRGSTKYVDTNSENKVVFSRNSSELN